MVHDRKIWVCSFLFRAYGFMQYGSFLLRWMCHLGLVNCLNVELRMVLLQFTVSFKVKLWSMVNLFYNSWVFINLDQYLILTKYDLLHIKCHQKTVGMLRCCLELELQWRIMSTGWRVVVLRTVCYPVNSPMKKRLRLQWKADLRVN